MICASVVLFDASVPYPSAWTALPILGTCLILLSGGQGGAAERLLSWRPIVGLGLISYSLYLWHQPLFAFARIPNLHDACPLVPLALTQFYVKRFAPQDRPLLAMPRKQASSYLHHGTKPLIGAAFAEDGRMKVLVIGDSYGKDFLNALAETPQYADLSLSFHPISSLCAAFMVPDDTPGFPPTPFAPKCEGVDRYKSRGLLDRMGQADVLILASNWQEWQAPYFALSLENIHKTTDAKIVILGAKSLVVPDFESILRVAPADRPALRAAPDPGGIATNKALLALNLPGFVDVQGLLCPDPAGCPIVGEEGGPLSMDGFHLTPSGARYLAARLFAAPALRAVFPGLPLAAPAP